MSYQDDIRANITEKIVAALKSGDTLPWRRPWSTYGPKLPTNIRGRQYNGINVICLMLATMQKNYPVNLWATYNQYRNAGAQVRRFEKGSQIVLWRPVERTRQLADGTERKETIPIMRTWTVFNVSQVDGYTLPVAQTNTPFANYAPAEAAFKATGADIRHGGSRPFYSLSDDFIQMPPKSSFESVHGYYATLAHEAIHWVQPRLKFKSSYALEELIAEVGGCFLCASLGIPQSDDLTNHQAYVASWIKELENDHAAVFRAAKQASLSCDFILKFSRKEESQEESEETGELVAV